MQIGHGNELGFAVNRLMDNAAERDLLAHNAKTLAAEKRHVLDNIVRELQPWLPQPKKQWSAVS